MQAVKSSRHEVLRSAAVIQQDHIVSRLPVSNGVFAPFSAVLIWFLWPRRQEFNHCSVLTFYLFIYGLCIYRHKGIRLYRRVLAMMFWALAYCSSLCTCFDTLSCGAHTGEFFSFFLLLSMQWFVEKRNFSKGSIPVCILLVSRDRWVVGDMFIWQYVYLIGYQFMHHCIVIFLSFISEQCGTFKLSSCINIMLKVCVPVKWCKFFLLLKRT